MDFGKNNKMEIYSDLYNYKNEVRVEMVFEKKDFIPELFVSNNGIFSHRYFSDLIYEEFFNEGSNMNVITEKEFKKSMEKDVKGDFANHFFEILSLLSLNDYKNLKTNEREFWFNIEGDLKSKFNNNDLSLDYLQKLINFIYLILKLPNEKKDKLYALMLLSNLPKLLEALNDEISSYFLNVKYLAPLRANVQRYYRESGISVDDIDSQGVNMPMILKDLPPNTREDFEKWTYENFGFYIGIESIQDHISLVISFSDDNKTEKLNLADVGFGFSQILPIIYTLWSNTVNRSINKPRLVYSYENVQTHILIEQPELHLHPAMQAKLVDALLKCINKLNKKKKSFSIILETHSELIVNRIGKLIYEGLFKEELCNVLIFSGDINNSSIESIEYNNEGVLEKWPLGFFQPDPPNNEPEDDFKWDEEVRK